MRKLKTKNLSPLLALDFGASTTKVLVTFVPQNKTKTSDKTPDILRVSASAVAPTPNHNPRDFSALLPVVKNLLQDLKLQLADQGYDGPDFKDTVFGFSGEDLPLAVSALRYHRPNPSAPLTEEELDLFYKKIEKKQQEKHSDLALLTSHPLALLIDDYKALNPVGFKGEFLLAQYLTVFSPQDLVKNLQLFAADLELYPLGIYPSPLSLARACLGPTEDPDLSAVLVEVGAQTTNLVLLDAGELVTASSFNIAGENFTHQIAETLQVPNQTAEHNKLNLEDETILSDTEIGATSAALSRALSVWLSAFSLELEELQSFTEHLPSNLILVGGSSQLLPLREELANSSWADSLNFAEPPRFHFITSEDLPGLSIENDIKLDSGYISTLGLLRLGVDKLSRA